MTSIKRFLQWFKAKLMLYERCRYAKLCNLYRPDAYICEKDGGIGCGRFRNWMTQPSRLSPRQPLMRPGDQAKHQDLSKFFKGKGGRKTSLYRKSLKEKKKPQKN